MLFLPSDIQATPPIHHFPICGNKPEMPNMLACSLQDIDGPWSTHYQFQLQPAMQQQSPDPSQQMSPQTAAQLYVDSLAAAAAVARQSVTCETKQKRDAIMHELAQFLSAVPSKIPKTLHNCTPEDLLVFLQSHYVVKHAGSITSQQQKTMAPGSLNNAVSSLTMGFRELQRNAKWDTASQTGNPCLSAQIVQWKKGYSRVASQAGYISRGAKEIPEDKVGVMLLHIRNTMTASLDPLIISEHARDGFVYSLLMSTGVGGINACEACLQDFKLPSTAQSSSMPALPLIYPEFKLAAGSIVEFVPAFLKTSPQRNSQGVQLTVQSDPFMDPLRWLQLAIQTAHACGEAITGPIVRPLRPDHRGYKQCSMTTRCMHRRLSKLLDAMGMNEGESMHSFRRGMAQHMNRQGLSTPAICGRMLICTEKVVSQCYLPAGRYDTGVTRCRSAVGVSGPQPVGMQTSSGHAITASPGLRGSGTHAIECWMPGQVHVSHNLESEQQG